MNTPKNIACIITASIFFVLSSINFFQVIALDFKQHISDEVLVDMSIFMAAGKEFTQSGMLYKRSENYPTEYGPDTPVYKFPPAYQLTIVPLINAGISETDFLTTYRCIYLLLYLFSIAILVFVYGRPLLKDSDENTDKYRFYSFSLLAALLACWYAPFREAFMNLHTEIPILFVICLSLLVLKKSPLLSGALLSIAFSIKIYPLFIVMYYLATQQWRVIAGFISGFILLSLYSIFYFGPGESVFYIKTILPILLNQEPVNHSQNLMLESFLYSYGLIDEINGIVHSIVKYTMLVVLIFIAGANKKNRLHSSALYFGMFVSGTLIWLPNYWLQYQMLLLIPILALAMLAIQSRSRWLDAMFICVSIVMCTQEQWYNSINLSLLEKLQTTDLSGVFTTQHTFELFIHAATTAPTVAFMFFGSKLLGFVCDLQSLIPEILFIISAWVLLIGKNDQAKLVFSVPPST